MSYSGPLLTVPPAVVTQSTVLGGPFPCLAYATMAVDVNVSAVSGTSPSLQLALQRRGDDGVWYPVWTPSAVTAAGVASTSVGPGCATAAVLTDQARLLATVTGTTPSFTVSVSVVGR